MQRLYVPERGRESMTGTGVPTATQALPSGAGRPPPSLGGSFACTQPPGPVPFAEPLADRRPCTPSLQALELLHFLQPCASDLRAGEDQYL